MVIFIHLRIITFTLDKLGKYFMNLIFRGSRSTTKIGQSENFPFTAFGISFNKT